MGSKYKSPLIRSRTTSVTQTVATPPDRSSTNEQTPFSGSDVLVYDNTPRPSPVVQHWRGRGCSSPRFDSPRPSRGSPYQWTPPSQTGGFYENSWSSQQNNSSGHSIHRPQFNKYRKQNTSNYSNRNNENDDESYFHPSMLEDPWAPLLNNSVNNE